MTQQSTIPVVVTFAGNDPTGGAGLLADVETLASMGCHAAPVITAVTVQDTQRVQTYTSIDPTMVIAQARAVLEDMPVAAFKMGMIGSIANAEAIHTILKDYPDIPVVLDPVLASGNNDALSEPGFIDALLTLLCPLATIVTPNTGEARQLAQEADNIDACAHELLDTGCGYVLVTGTHENTSHVVNRFYGNHRLLETFTWDRLPHSYHGSGCTLASAIAGLLAQGLDPFAAVFEAQEFTWQSLQHGYRVGMGQHLPNRLFWTLGNETESGHVAS